MIKHAKPSKVWDGIPTRWVDASRVGDVGGYPTDDGEGVAITEEMIDQFVANFYRHDDLIPMDGAGITPVHGTVEDSGLPAVGWVLNAEKRGTGPNAHLWLEVQCSPDAEESVGSKGILYGSIAYSENAIDRDSGEQIGAELHSYALTNRPMRSNLAPHGLSRESKGIVYTMSRPIVFGPAKTLRDQIFAILKIDPTEKDAFEIRCEVEDKLRAITDIAMIEDITEGGAAQPPPPNAMEKENMTIRTRTKKPATKTHSVKFADGQTLAMAGMDIAALRALLKIGPEVDDEHAQQAIVEQIGKLTSSITPVAPPPGANPPAAPVNMADQPPAPTPEQQTMLLTDLTSAVGAIFGKPEMTPEEAAALLKSSIDLLAGAVNSAGSGAGGGTQMSNKNDARVVTLEAKLDAQSKELSELRQMAKQANEDANFRKRVEAEAFVLEEAEKVAITLSEERIDRLAKIVMSSDAGKELVKEALLESARPPAGTIVKNENITEAKMRHENDARALTEKHLTALREQKKGIAEHKLYAMAQNLAAKERPDLFGVMAR